ncbi:hypothetical protein [Arenibaculum pallidiluteum]|uniref:hypothetical protein n=1 Tax=Arenibaculum pallidiluteum TaxID=2812559 RepID=UPI001A971764|nr:hypothetical protein [Arenibaculum pallidiluteum]
MPELAPKARVQGMLARFDAVLAAGDIATAVGLFADECYWRDLVAFTWNIRTMEGRDQVRDMLAATLATTRPRGWQIAAGEDATESGGVTEADGIGSAVARLASAPVLRHAEHSTAAIYGYWPGFSEQGYQWRYGIAAGLAVIPTNGRLHCICLSVSTARFRHAMRRNPAAGFHATVAELAPELATELAGSAPVGGLTVFPGRRGFMRQPCGQGWALVGDPGYFKDPVTAHGITDTLRDAELLAIAAARGSDADIEDYGAVRDALSVPLFELTDAVASFAWDLPTLRTHHEALNRAMKHGTEHLAALPPPVPVFNGTRLPAPAAAMRDAAPARRSTA